MNISHITIRNILGIQELELSPGGFTQISGRNGTGKTSVLEAVKSALKSGHDATLLRAGSEKGEVVLVLDDGTELTKTVTDSGSTTAVRRDGKKIARPGEAIKALTDALSVNPVEFLLAPKKDRVKALLEAMPIEADADHLAAISGVPVSAQPGLHAIHVIEVVRSKVYDARTGTNRAVTEKQATIKQLEAAVPPAPVGVTGSEAELVASIDEARSARDTMLTKIAAKLDGLRTENASAIAVMMSAQAAALEAMKTAHAESLEQLRASLRENEGKASVARAAANDKATAACAPLNEQLAIIRNDREASGRRQQTLETIAAMRTELEVLTGEAEAQTKALTEIDKYKSDLLNSLPIPGLEVIDGEILRDGVPFDRLNTAQQVDVAVELAKLRAADLGVICVDRIEALDSESLEAFRASALASGLQLFVTRVTDDAFSVSTGSK